MRLFWNIGRGRPNYVKNIWYMCNTSYIMAIVADLKRVPPPLNFLLQIEQWVDDWNVAVNALAWLLSSSQKINQSFICCQSFNKIYPYRPCPLYRYGVEVFPSELTSKNLKGIGLCSVWAGGQFCICLSVLKLTSTFDHPLPNILLTSVFSSTSFWPEYLMATVAKHSIVLFAFNNLLLWFHQQRKNTSNKQPFSC